MIFFILLAMIVILIPLTVFFVVCHWKIFTKAGQEGWKCLIPFYNLSVQLEITKQPAIWLLYFFIPVINIYFGIRHFHGLSRAFGKDKGFTAGLILLPIVFFPLLAFGTARYQYNVQDNLINELHEME